MACIDPLRVWRAVWPDESGQRPIFFKPPGPGADVRTAELPCGRCIECRLAYARDWQIRCVHEASLYGSNVFLTLTYKDCPEDGRLVPRDLALFHKRLLAHARRHPDNPRRVRFFACGEYGDLNGRPHYHSLIFNWDFSDRCPVKSSSAHQLYQSATLDELWGHGEAWIGTFSPLAAGYVARYVTKKITGDKAKEHYRRVGADGRDVWIPQEYATCSKFPALGTEWFLRFYREVYPNDFVVVDGRKVKPPRYYDRLLKKVDPLLFQQVMDSRDAQDADEAASRSFEGSRARLRVKEEVATSRLATFMQRKL